jgi:hypothetical protein
MIQNIAISTHVGDRVYNCFMDELIIKSHYYKYDNNGKLSSIIFDTLDKNNNTKTYSFDNLYDKDFTWESDEEKSWISWASQNKDFILEFDHIDTIKNIYQIGFTNGFDYRRSIKHEELMQK